MVLWSLEVEAQFYLLAPLLAMLYAISDRHLRRLSFLGLGVALYLLSPYVFGNADNFFNYALYFLCGMLVADYYVTGDIRAGRPAKARAVNMALLALVPGSVVVSNLGWAPELVLPVYCGATLLAALQGQMVGTVMRNRALSTIGGMCYTIYLYHFLVIAAVGKITVGWFGRLPYALFFTVQLALHGLAIVVAGAVLFRVTEKPFMGVSARNMVRALGRIGSEGVRARTDAMPETVVVSDFGNKFRR